MTSTVYIAKNVYGGDGLGRLGDGRVVFVPGAFAGEQVRAEIVEEKRHFVKARLVEIVERNPDRVEPSGPVVPGMTYAALSPAGELKVKEAQLVDFFERARLMPSAPIARIKSAGDENPLHYRNKAVYHFARQDGAWALGYREEPSHRILDLADDPLVRPEIVAALPEIRRHLHALLTQGPVAIRRETERKANVTIRWSARTGVKWWIGDAPRDVILKETTCDRTFEVPAGGFYQVNPVAGEALVKAVVDEYRRAPGPLADLYCGVGVFGLCCRPPKLFGVESGREAIDFARRNAAAQKQPDATFVADQTVRVLKRAPIGGETTVIVDPPRDGFERGVAEGLLKAAPKRILYVSCDPATLLRDVKNLQGGYAVESVRWVNMFPRTARFETFVTLTRRG